MNVHFRLIKKKKKCILLGVPKNVYFFFFFNDSLFKHKDYKLVGVQDEKAKNYTFIAFTKEGKQEELVLEIRNRKTKEIISTTNYPKADSFNILYDYSKLPKGYYEATIRINNWSETRVFSIKD